MEEKTVVTIYETNIGFGFKTFCEGMSDKEQMALLGYLSLVTSLLCENMKKTMETIDIKE